MTKSFLYSLLIHLFLAALFLVFLLEPSPKYEEQKISIKLRSQYQPPQPICACQSDNTTPPPPKPAIIPIKPPKPKVSPAPIPLVQNTRVIAPSVEIPSPKPAPAVTAVQSPTLPSVKASPPPPAPPPPPAVNIEKEYLKLNLGEIRALLIQNQQYPKQAKRLRMQGDVELYFQLNTNGSVEDLKIVQSSGFEILDEDARALILKTAPQFPKPSKNVQLRLPISYVLR